MHQSGPLRIARQAIASRAAALRGRRSRAERRHCAASPWPQSPRLKGGAPEADQVLCLQAGQVRPHHCRGWGERDRSVEAATAGRHGGGAGGCPTLSGPLSRPLAPLEVPIPQYQRDRRNHMEGHPTQIARSAVPLSCRRTGHVHPAKSGSSSAPPFSLKLLATAGPARTETHSASSVEVHCS